MATKQRELSATAKRGKRRSELQVRYGFPVGVVLALVLVLLGANWLLAIVMGLGSTAIVGLVLERLERRRREPPPPHVR